MILVYDYEHLDCGKVESIRNYNIITISKETWAPGIWAGLEECTVNIGNKIFAKITNIDLSKREITVDTELRIIGIGDTLSIVSSIVPVQGETP